MPPPAPRLAQHPRVASAFLPPRSRHMSPSTGPQLLQGWRLFRSEGREGSPKGPPHQQEDAQKADWHRPYPGPLAIPSLGSRPGGEVGSREQGEGSGDPHPGLEIRSGVPGI